LHSSVTGEKIGIKSDSTSAIHRFQESEMLREVLHNHLIEFGMAMKLVRLIKLCLNETFIKIHRGKYLSYSFPIENGLKQGYALSPMFFNFALQYSIRKVQENQVGLKLSRTHRLLAYADDVNLLGDNIGTVNKNTETLTDANKEAGLEVKVEKTKYMLVFRNPNADHSRDMKIVYLRSVVRFTVVNVVPSPPILVTLIMEALRFSETSVIKKATQRNIPE
jgi:hypothetical protein